MKRLLCFLLLLYFMSCHKQPVGPTDEHSFPPVLLLSLKSQLMPEDFSRLDFKKAVASEDRKEGKVLVRIPFKESRSHEFVLLHIDPQWRILEGRIIEISGERVAKTVTKVPEYEFEGVIQIYSLQRALLVNSSIERGYITAFHPGFHTGGDAYIQPSPVVVLPEVIVTGYYSSGTNLSWSDWLNLFALLGYSSYYYYSLDPLGYAMGGGTPGQGSGSDNNGNYTGGGGSIPQEPGIAVEPDNYGDKPAINLEEYLRCFSLIPDAGAECSIELLTDLPVDGDPEQFFNWQTNSPGHSFLLLRKKNGSQSVLQNIGFYPRSVIKPLATPAPVPGKFVDDSGHDYNASIKMAVSPANFQQIVTYLLYLSKFVKYDVDEYNCTDFALEVFNLVRYQKLEPQRYDLPGGMAPYGSNLPNGVFLKLQEMKNGNHPEAANISIPGLFGWVPDSSGPCQ